MTQHCFHLNMLMGHCFNHWFKYSAGEPVIPNGYENDANLSNSNLVVFSIIRVEIEIMEANQTLETAEFCLEREMCRLLGFDYVQAFSDKCDQALVQPTTVVKTEAPDENQIVTNFQSNFAFEDTAIKNEPKSEITDETSSETLKMKLESLLLPDPYFEQKPQKPSKMPKINGRFPCNQCPKLFKTKCTLLKHIKVIHVGLKVKPKCGKCGKRYQSAYHLKRHVQQVHEGVRVHCTQCPMNFYDNRFLKQHIRLEHGVEQ